MTEPKLTAELAGNPGVVSSALFCLSVRQCFQASSVIECNNVMDKRKCRVCSKVWTEPCNFDEDYD